MNEYQSGAIINKCRIDPDLPYLPGRQFMIYLPEETLLASKDHTLVESTVLVDCGIRGGIYIRVVGKCEIVENVFSSDEFWSYSQK